MSDRSNGTPTTPGEKALQAMKNLTNSVSIFKVPKAPQKRKRQMNILPEDQYIEELGKIIQNDFFPDLKKLKAQNQYLDAVEKNDVIKLRELYAKYSGRTPSQRGSGFDSPATFETPINKGDSTPDIASLNRAQSVRSSSSSTAASTTSKKCPSDGHSLDSFLSNYTSEDNQSFQEIIETSDRKFRNKFARLYQAETDQALQMEAALTLPSIEKQFEPIEGSKPIDTWTYKNRNYIMYVPDGVELTDAEKIEAAKRKQEVSYVNTRLQHNPFDDRQSKETITELAKSQAKVLSGKIGVDGNVVDSHMGPNVRGFGFVKTPSPCPGVDDTPMMTWGEIEGTPFRLDGSDTPIRPSTGPSFRIVETSRRENLALELAEKACERLRGQKAKAMEVARRNIASPHIRSTLDRMATMSPAAKRLATSRLGIQDSILSPTPRRSSVTPGALRKSTPSPLVRRKTPLNKLNNKTTPAKVVATSSAAVTAAVIADEPLLTDDLLRIPPVARTKASDFF